MTKIFGYIISFIRGFFIRENYNLRNFALFLLVVLAIQYYPIFGMDGVSPIKVVVMAVCPLVLLLHLVPNKALVFGSIYWIWVFISAYFINTDSFRSSTVFYSAMFVISYITFYTIVRNYHVISLPFFIRFLKAFIFITVIVLLLQQACIMAGIRYAPVFNLYFFLDRGLGANSLFLEPSHYARVLLVLYYAYLKCNEYWQGCKMTLKDIFNPEHRLVTIAFLWAMLSMGSGTAIISLGILALYFLKGWQTVVALPVMLVGFYFLSQSEIRSVHRAVAVAEAVKTGKNDVVVDTDDSAAVRILPIMNTLNIDLSKRETWVGEGCDRALSGGYLSSHRYMGDINDYGFIAFILSLILVFNCAINFRSLATVMFFMGVGGGTTNIAYCWAILMIFTVVKYFHDNPQFEYEE